MAAPTFRKFSEIRGMEIMERNGIKILTGDTPMHECIPLGGKPFTEIELAEWDKEEAAKPLFVGPIRGNRPLPPQGAGAQSTSSALIT